MFEQVDNVGEFFEGPPLAGTNMYHVGSYLDDRMNNWWKKAQNEYQWHRRDYYWKLYFFRTLSIPAGTRYLHPFPDWAEDAAQELDPLDILGGKVNYMMTNHYGPEDWLIDHTDGCYGRKLALVVAGETTWPLHMRLNFHDVEPSVLWAPKKTMYAWRDPSSKCYHGIKELPNGETDQREGRALPPRQERLTVGFAHLPEFCMNQLRDVLSAQKTITP